MEKLQEIQRKAQDWLSEYYDSGTQAQVRQMMEHDPELLYESFYKNLEFGTGGMRGIMGVGSNRMNVYTVAMATQGFADYLSEVCEREHRAKRVVIAYDCRNNSPEFARTTARVFAGNSFEVYLFEDMRPTPELSFAVRYLQCCAGVMVTASHNPKEYNGYKAYGADGGQLVSPEDKNVMESVRQITSYSKVKIQSDDAHIRYIGEEVDRVYLEQVKSLSLAEVEKEKSKLKIVYSPLHGTGRILVPQALNQWGFESLICEPHQMQADGNFSTVASPNPEERLTMKMAIELARKEQADLVLATDPDADRVGVAVPDGQGGFLLLNGNQTATLFVDYLLSQWQKKGKLTSREYIVKTIVTTELLGELARNYQVRMYDVLTGFKYIAEVIGKKEGKEVFIGGGEESYGYLAGEFVRDKDAIIACCVIAEMCAVLKSEGKTMLQRLEEIYAQYGFYQEELISVTHQGSAGLAKIREMMEMFRKEPPRSLGGMAVKEIRDYKIGFADLPKADVLQFFLEDGSKITVRPSGTEPKIKFYFGIKSPWQATEDFAAHQKRCTEKIRKIQKDLNLTV